MSSRLRRVASAFAVFWLVSLPALAQESSKSEKPPSQENDALAQIAIRQKPAYQVSCRASGDLRKEVLDHSLPEPTAEQLEALQFLEAETRLYESSARTFQGRLTSIVRHHFEARRRRVVTAVEREVELQKEFLTLARDTAIGRLEIFVAQYQGERAHPHSTPDAMLRLAALYEERARSDYDADLSEELKPAIALYEKIAVEFPAYEEIAATLYYLGHALTDSGRLEEAQQSWRSLVCTNRYQVKLDLSNPERVALQRLEQDHPDAFWTEWYNKNPLPLDEAGARPSLSQVGVSEEELIFRDPYKDCEPVLQKTIGGSDPRYLAEIWWQLGNYHFDHLDPEGGPYNLNRAVSAYTHSLEYKKPPLYGVAMYKQAWAHFKQQRYRAAIEYFVQLLRYADEEEARSGDPGGDFRKEAFTYIAGSLTYVDLDGPPPQDPLIPRNDVLDSELDPNVAEEKMSLSIARVQDPALIPQNEPWTVGIYKALAQEFLEISQRQNAILTMELTLKKFPMDRDAPEITSRVAGTYDEMARLAQPGSESRREYAAKALRARSRLADFVGATPWTDAHKKDREALAQAELLAQVGLKQAAADHTNFGRAFKEAALQLSDAKSQKELLGRAVEEYRLAAEGWGAYLRQNPNAVDAYESQYWLADAYFWTAVLQVPLGRMPTSEEITLAYENAADVRDSNANDKYKQPAAYFAVALTEKILDAEAEAFEHSGGRQGIERKEQVTFKTGEDGKKRVQKEDLPPAVQAAVCARDEYNAAISLEEDLDQNGLLYATQAAEYFFVYGQFEEAQRRFLPIYQSYCGRNQWGYNAWEKLISMSNFQNDAKQSRSLVESKSCAFDEESRKAVEAIVAPVKIGVAYLEAGRLFEDAMQMKEGKKRDKTWREAAAAYKVALDVAPDRNEAPEAVMNGAFAYKQVGEYDKAIAMYELFIKAYGDETTLAKLRSSNAESYEERVKFLGDAYQALAGSYVLFFDYPQAAETFDAISAVAHFPIVEKKQAAKQGLMLYVNLDDRAGMERMFQRYESLGADPEELSEAEFLIATAVVKKWDPNSPDKGANQTARLAAEKSMSRYHDVNKGRAAALKYVVRAAYLTAQAKTAGGSTVARAWWMSTVESFDRYLAATSQTKEKSEATGTEEAGMAAEAAYRLLDFDLKKDFDYETGHHRYSGTVVDVVAAYTADAKDAKIWYDRLQVIVDKYVSPKWAAIAIARQGSVYDSLRTGLYNTRPPELKMFTPQQERSLRIAEESDNLDLVDKADEIRFQVRQGWTKKRDQELDSADAIVVDRYAVAVMLARRYNLSDESITRSIRRLAFLTDVAGEAKMSGYVSKNKDLAYQAGMFQRLRPGVTAPPRVDALPRPGPAGGAQ